MVTELLCMGLEGIRTLLPFPSPHGSTPRESCACGASRNSPVSQQQGSEKALEMPLLDPLLSPSLFPFSFFPPLPRTEADFLSLPLHLLHAAGEPVSWTLQACLLSPYGAAAGMSQASHSSRTPFKPPVSPSPFPADVSPLCLRMRCCNKPML